MNCYCKENVWTIIITGAASSGKSTIAKQLYKRMQSKKCCKDMKIQLIDADDIKKTLSAGVGQSLESKLYEADRLSYICNVLNDNNISVILAKTLPFRKVKERIKNTVKNCKEIYLKCDLDELKKRDVKGLYSNDSHIKMAVKDYNYEISINPDLILDTNILKIEECLDKIMEGV